MGKSAWVSTIYIFAVTLLTLCGIMGAIMINKATQPYYAMLDMPQRLRNGQLDHYLTSKTHSHIFELVRKAVADISREQYDLAEQHIAEATALDPGNALFSYMMAGLCFKSDDYSHMWKHLKTGNDIGRVRIYASQYVPPEAWTHPEVPMIRHMATVMTKGISTEDELWELVRMGNVLAWCEPADVDTFAAGLAIRESAARRIRELAELDGNTHLVSLCSSLMKEKRAAYGDYEEVMASSSLRKVGIPTLLMAMASYRRNPHVRESLVVNAFERQSEAISELRYRVLKTPVNSKLER